MKHTKGEWKVSDNWNVTTDNRLIVSCGGFSDGTHETHDENIANAHLISAAPDMYEALKVAVAILKMEGYQDNQPVLQPMITALAKAEVSNDPET